MMGKTTATLITKKAIINHFMQENINLRKEISDLRKDMRKMIDDAVNKEIGEKIDMINAALNETILHKEILIEKGLFTRQEINDKYTELKEKAHG
jgi:regulator of replication initiation timing